MWLLSPALGAGSQCLLLCRVQVNVRSPYLLTDRRIRKHVRCVAVHAEVKTSMERHHRAVKDVSTNVRQFYDRKEQFRIYHGSTNSTRHQGAKRKNIVDTSSLSHVLEINPEKQTAIVEPNVSMDRLVEETLKHGLIPPVVMEFPGITVGGGYSGTSGESSSFKHGFFNRTMNYAEMVLADGKLVTCSNKEMPDLFHGAAGAVGSLGVITLVELQLIEAKQFVETTYYPVSSLAEAVSKIKQVTSDPDLDYVDGIIFSKDQGAVITGRMTNSPSDAQNPCTRHFSNADDPWFYIHVHDVITGTDRPSTDIIPLAEYLFRYDRGGFWVGASAFEYFKIPFNHYSRRWLDDFLHTRMLYTALHASGQSSRFVVQDLALPYATAQEFMEYADETFGIYPLWLCPLKQSPLPTIHPHLNEKEADGKTLKPMLNIGLWGWGPPSHDEFVKKNRDLEHKLRILGGMKWLYAHTYYTEDEFWNVYDRPWYDALREKYNATTLPSVYDKVKVDIETGRGAADRTVKESLIKRWPFGGIYGIKKAINSGTYLEARASTWRSRIQVDRVGNSI